MKLYRLAHFQIAHQLRKNPQDGCIYCLNLPYFVAFDSSSAAILESHVLLATRKMPSSLLIVEYELPLNCNIITLEDAILRIKECDYLNSAHNSYIMRFLNERKALLASFPSASWRNQANFLVNPRHPKFREILISRIYPCT